jgi:hypothetical protein
MRKNWNWPLWAGFVCAIAGLVTFPFFVQFPITRDFPWANLVLFCAGAVLLGLGLLRAFRTPTLYRGKIFGPILAALGLLSFGLFSYGMFYIARQLPRAAAAPHVGEKAPDFTLRDQDAKATSLADLRSSSLPAPNPKTSAVLLIFYRGHW